MLGMDYEIQYKKGVENKVADALDGWNLSPLMNALLPLLEGLPE